MEASRCGVEEPSSGENGAENGKGWQGTAERARFEGAANAAAGGGKAVEFLGRRRCGTSPPLIQRVVLSCGALAEGGRPNKVENTRALSTLSRSLSRNVSDEKKTNK